MFPSTQLVFNKSCRLNFSTSGSSGNSGIDDGGKGANVNPAGPPPTAAAPSAPRPAAKRRLVTGTVLVEFLLEGGM